VAPTADDKSKNQGGRFWPFLPVKVSTNVWDVIQKIKPDSSADGRAAVSGQPSLSRCYTVKGTGGAKSNQTPRLIYAHGVSCEGGLRQKRPNASAFIR
jgi:hypothetical protein